MRGYSKQHQTLVRSMLWGSGSQSPGREISKCILVVTPLAFWTCDWSIRRIETLFQEYSRAAVK